MLIIGERINGMFKSVKDAIQNKDKKAIQELALTQLNAGADMLDVNVGTATDEPAGVMEWLVKTIQEVTDRTISIDSGKTEVIEAGLKACKNKALINSTTGTEEKMNQFFPLAAKYNSSIIGLAIDEHGVPGNVEGRTEIALKMLAKAAEYNIPADDLYLDPIIMQLKFAQPQCKNVLEAIREFKMLSNPSPRVVVGLSNVSSKAARRELVNRTYLAMCIAMGLDTAILDPNDRELMETMITAELLLNKNIYCDSFIEAYKK